MPLLAHTHDDGCREFVLAPNGSLGHRAAHLFLGVTAALMGTIALVFVVQGFWPVLPFAGLEFGVLWWALTASMRSSRRREVIRIEEGVVTVGAPGRGAQRARYVRHWTRVRLERPRIRTMPTRLLIESQGRATEVGRFLTDAERHALHPDLRRFIGSIGESPALG